jgi:hypothetical protein
MAIAVEITGSDDMPARTWIADAAAANNRRPVHLPNCDLATTVVLPQNVGQTVAAEITSGNGMPAGAWITNTATGNERRPVHLQIATSPLSFCQSMSA